MEPKLKINPLSISVDSSLSTTISYRNREIINAIQRNNPRSLLAMTLARSSISPVRVVKESTETFDHMVMIRKSVDVKRVSGVRGERAVSSLKSQLKIMEIEEAKREFWNKQCSFRVFGLEKALKDAEKKQAEEINNREVYKNLLKRTKETLVFLQLRAGSLREGLVAGENLVKSERKRFELHKEAACQAIAAFKELRGIVESEKKEYSFEISLLERSISKGKLQNDQKANWKTLQRAMFEAAAVEDQEKKNLVMKQNLSLHCFWYSVLSRIHSRNIEKSKKLENAFQAIKTSTGLSNISQIVSKFLSKEETYEALMKTVSVKEIEVTKYQENIEKLQRKVDASLYRDLNEAQKAQEAQLQKEKAKVIQETNKRMSELQNKHSKVKNWLLLMIQKFLRILNKDLMTELEGNSLKSCITTIHSLFSEVNSHDLASQVEANRSLAVKSLILSLSKAPHVIPEPDLISPSSFIGLDERL